MHKFATLAFLVLSLTTFAQIVPPSGVTGNNRVGIRWRYIDSRAVKVIYPEGNEAEATRVANIINYIYDSAAVTVGEKRKHLDLLLQTEQVISNGYVALAPYRSEFYSTGIQNFNWLGSVNWIDGLAFHEYRHALQFANSRRGLTKVFSILGGQNYWALLANLSLPNWYFEGDAVQTETMFSGAGRGRTPYFFQEQRTLLLNGKKYPYIKARNGSLRSLVPDHYRLGYAMLHQVRSENGPEVWRNILRDASAFKGVFYPFSQAMNRHTGNGTRATYRRTYDTLRTQWEEELEGIELTETEQWSKRPKRIVTHYEWPHFLKDTSIVCRKESYNRTAEVVRIYTDGKEEHLLNLGFGVTESFLSVNDDKVAWTQQSTDPRWLNRNYSDIHCYDIKTGKRRRVTRRTKLFSPHYSASKKQFVAVKANEHLKNSIVFIHAGSGEEASTVPNPDNDFLSYPKWTKDSKAIVYLMKRGSLIRMVKYDLETQTTTELTPFSQQVIGGIQLSEDRVYFDASYSGINNIYAVNLNGDQEIRQISSVRVGANMPAISPDQETVAFAQLGVMGNAIELQATSFNSAPVLELEEPEVQERYRILTTPVERKLFNSIPDRRYESKAYKGPVRGAKLHSWSLQGNQNLAAVTVQVNNILNDFGATLTGGVNLNEGRLYAAGNVNYAKYYLPVGLNAAINGRSLIAPKGDIFNESDTTRGADAVRFTETIYSGGLSLPLTWLHGIYATHLRVYANGGFINTSRYRLNDSIDLPTAHDLTVLEGGLQFLNARGRARQNIYTRFGQELTAYYGSSVDGASALKFQAQGALYLPGFLRNHGFKLEAGYKEESLSNDYRFFDDFRHARGYTPIQGDQEIVYGINYMMPLVYPDFGFGGVAYLKRIRANLFADFSQVLRTQTPTTPARTFEQNSAGVELYFDTVFLNILPIAVGARFSALMNTNYYDRKQTSAFGIFFAGSF